MGIKERIKLTTIRKYLEKSGLLKGNAALKHTISNLGIEDMYIESFEKEFGEKTPEELVDFLMGNGDNAYKVGVWVARQRPQSSYSNKNFRCNGEKYTGQRDEYQQ